MKPLKLSDLAIDHLRHWRSKDNKKYERIKRLMEHIQDTPFTGLGKPEPLKGNWTGYWSRRIDREHRLIYKVAEAHIWIASCKGHYD